MKDRLADIKSGSFTARDVSWLVYEVERLQGQIESVRTYLSEAVVGHHSSGIFALLNSVLHQRRGAMTELNDIHDILAEALEYPQDALDDPESPCPGAWVTGDHTAASLALEAAKKLKSQEAVIESFGRSADRARDYSTQLEQQLEMAQDRIRDIQGARQIAVETATGQIIELQCELAEVRDTKKGRLRRELAARREHCCCVFQDEGIDEGRLLPHPDCREHGVEANDRRLAGEKAVSTLQYVRKYFMGSEHGHEV
jgi:hypothetical protein